MEIDSLKIKNFRGYREEKIIKFDDLTVFVGRNDVGKSTILEALDIFFNDGKGNVKIEKEDVNIHSRQDNDLETIISVCFRKLPQEIVIDTENKTTLKNEYMLNSLSQLEIIKKYRNGGSSKVFIRALHPTNEHCSSLLLKKNSELKRIIEDESIDCDNKNINAMMRMAIWNKYIDDLKLKEIEIDVTKEDAKKIWGQLSLYLPSFSLFQADRKNNDDDSEVQDPLKEAVKQILKEPELQKELEDVAKQVSNKLKEVSQRTLDKLKEMDPAVAASLNPVIPSSESLKWQDVFKNVSISGDENIPINKRGSGVKRLILLNFFRAEAERQFNEGNNTGIIYAIEEPETSQHTYNQQLLINALKKLSTTNDTQVILTTHSAAIVKELEYRNIRIINQNKNGDRDIVAVDEAQLKYPSLNEVNYLAFGEISAEYHDELYSFLEYQEWKNDYVKREKTIPYIKLLKDGTTKKQEVTLTEYIRHQIHHPENSNNTHYTKEQLEQSIIKMRLFIKSKSSF